MSITKCCGQYIYASVTVSEDRRIGWIYYETIVEVANILSILPDPADKALSGEKMPPLPRTCIPRDTVGANTCFDFDFDSVPPSNLPMTV